MARAPKDPGLSEIAKCLNVLTWTKPLDQECPDRGRRLWQDGRLKNVAAMADHQSYLVRLYMNGEARTLGWVKGSQRWADAARFADMCAMHFWNYRIRGGKEPTGDNLNFSVEQAKQDLANEEAAMKLIGALEAYLRQSGGLYTGESAERRSARREIALVAGELNSKLDEIRAIQSKTVEVLAMVVARLPQPPSPVA